MTTLFSLPKQAVFNSSGDPLMGANLYFFETASSTPKSVFYDVDLNTPYGQPVQSDAYGVFPQIFLEDGLYRVTLVDANGVTQWTVDGVGAASLSVEDVGTALYPISAAETASGLTDDDLTPQYSYGDVRRYGAAGDGVTDDTAAIQSAILASLSISSLTEQPTGCAFPVLLTGDHLVTGPIYLPRYTDLRGSHVKARLTTAGNHAVLVLGRSLSENSWIDIKLRDFEIYGNLTGSGQVGIKAAWTGASAYGYALRFSNIYIRNLGGHGIYIASDNAAGMILYTHWDGVKCVNSNGYGAYFKVNVFNDALFDKCSFEENLLGGVFIDYFGSGTAPAEAVTFQNCTFESNGVLIGSADPHTAGSFGFKSLMYEGQYSFNSCYFEGNGNSSTDTTGANIWCQTPMMLEVSNSIMVSSNNQVWINSGGMAKVEGCFLSLPASGTSIFTFDGPPPGTSLAHFHNGLNRYDGTYTFAQLVNSINGATTKFFGYTSPNNYLFKQPRSTQVVLRDTSGTTANNGAIGYNAVRRITNNADSATTIPNDGIGSICKNTITAMMLVTDNYTSETAAFFVTPNGVKLIEQSGTKFSQTKDNASTFNVYYDSVTTSRVVVQNKSGGSGYIAVRFIGCEPMMHADDGYYESEYLA